MKAAMPPAQPPPDFTSPLKYAVLCQFAIGAILLVPYHMLAVQVLWLGSVLAFWAGMAFVYFRRGAKPTRLDLIFVRWGFLFLFVVVSPLIAYLVLTTL